MYQRRPSSIVFNEAGISNSSKLAVTKLAVTGTDDPFKALTEDLSHLRETDQNVVQEELPAKPFIDLDDNIVTTVSISCDEDIVAEILDPVKATIYRCRCRRSKSTFKYGIGRSS